MGYIVPQDGDGALVQDPLGAGRMQVENKQKEVIFHSSFICPPSTSFHTLGRCRGNPGVSSGLGQGLAFETD